jgi:ammonia channel protein AmtB
MMQAQNDEFRPNNQGNLIFGTIILLVGWLFFNGGRHPSSDVS